MKFTIDKISQLISGKVEGDSTLEITGPGSIENGTKGQICFFANPKYEDYIYSTKCSAIIIAHDYQLKKVVTPTIIRVDNVYEAISTLLAAIDTKMVNHSSISQQASIDSTAIIGEQTRIGDFTIVGPNVEIGIGNNIYGQVYIGNDIQIGNNCTIYPGVKLYNGTIIGDNCTIHSNSVLGSDGFGFSQNNKGVYAKIPQTGIVRLGSNVEVGANTVIDRATIGETFIEDGVKLDNLIQIGHNVKIGEDTAIAAQAGISGSTKIGKQCIIGGQVGFAGHIEIADGSMFQAKSGIASSIKEPNKKYYGYPILEYQSYLRSYAYFRKLPDIVDKIRTLEKELDILRQDCKKT